MGKQQTRMSEQQARPKRHYYARYHCYGIATGVRNNDGTEEILPGSILRFTTRQARDAWVDDEVWDGRFRREALTARNMARALRSPSRRWFYGRWSPPLEGEYEVRELH